MLRKLLRSEFSAPTSESSNRNEMKKENHLFCGIESSDRQETCSERKLRPQETKQINASERKSGKSIDLPRQLKLE